MMRARGAVIAKLLLPCAVALLAIAHGAQAVVSDAAANATTQQG